MNITTEEARRLLKWADINCDNNLNSFFDSMLILKILTAFPELNIVITPFLKTAPRINVDEMKYACPGLPRKSPIIVGCIEYHFGKTEDDYCQNCAIKLLPIEYVPWASRMIEFQQSEHFKG